MLAAIQVTYTIGKHTLVDDVSLEINAGEVVAIIGANGAGKTTLLRLLSGELNPTQGSIQLDGQPLESYRARDLARQRAMMRQHVYMNFDFTAYEVVMMGRHPHIRGGETPKDHQIVCEMLRQTESSHLSDQLYATLSGGEKSRVTLSRVLAQQTPILMLDEPTSAMDLRHQQLTMRLVRRLADDGGAVVAVLHDLNLAAMYADRVAMMVGGRLFLIDEPTIALTADNIEKVFSMQVEVISHPSQPCPLIVPMMP
ncbi:MAG: heme ABC transporter ATP-binding protein [Chloroflexi bacterium]|nr:heme ABC transporter ATP-binding protein [Chloroflexota bacterium]